MKKLLLFFTFIFIASYNFAQSANKDEQETVFTIVENMPVFPGGNEAMTDFIRKKIKYPKKAKRASKQGTVYVTFIISNTGAIQDLHVLRGITGAPELDAAALKVIKSMPKWEPGTQNGKKVNVQYNLPIKFILK
jgi:TonB family protein